MTTVQAARYAVHAADQSVHASDLVDVWTGSLRTSDGDRRYAWIYRDNPSGPASCWVLRDTAAGGVVGTAAVFPRCLLGMGRTWRAGIAGDFAVRPAHRALGPALMLQRAVIDACQNGNYDLVYGFPNHASWAAQVRAGFRDLGHATDLRKTLRSAPALARRYGTLAGSAGPLVDAVLRLRERWFARTSSQFRFHETTTFDERFDAFVARIGTKLPLTGERTSRYLNWRFGGAPDGPYRTLVMERASGGGIAGYLVWCLREREAVIVDLLAEDLEYGVPALATELLRQLRQVRADAVRARYFGAPRLVDVLRPLGFRARPSGRHVVIYVSPHTAFSDALMDRNNWYLLEGDSDL